MAEIVGREQGVLDVCESRERRDNFFAEKNAKILDQKQQFSIWGIFIFLAAEKPTFGGGVMNSKLARQCPC